MDDNSIYRKIVEKISKEEFISIFSSCRPETWFSDRELKAFAFPAHASSLAGRYLIKKTICDVIDEKEKMNEIEIINNDFGKPEVLLGVNIHHALQKKGIKKVDCSISHSKRYITGMIIFSF